MIIWIDIENIMLTEMSDKCNRICLICRTWGKIKLIENKWSSEVEGWEEGGLEEGDYKVKFPA